MNKACVILVLTLLCNINLLGQTRNPKAKDAIPNKSKTVRTDTDSDCMLYNTYSPSQRLVKYPFSKALQVFAVSFKSNAGQKTDTTNLQNEYNKRGLQIKKGILDTTTLIEKKKLTMDQIDHLTALLYNIDYKYKKRSHIIETMSCYEPRNALIFLDKNEQVFDYLEICFSCLRSNSQNDKFDIGSECTQKYELMSNYFKKIGVNYGTLGSDYHFEELRYLK